HVLLWCSGADSTESTCEPVEHANQQAPTLVAAHFKCSERPPQVWASRLDSDCRVEQTECAFDLDQVALLNGGNVRRRLSGQIKRPRALFARALANLHKQANKGAQGNRMAANE